MTKALATLPLSVVSQWHGVINDGNFLPQKKKKKLKTSLRKHSCYSLHYHTLSTVSCTFIRTGVQSKERFFADVCIHLQISLSTLSQYHITLIISTIKKKKTAHIISIFCGNIQIQLHEGKYEQNNAWGLLNSRISMCQPCLVDAREKCLCI